MTEPTDRVEPTFGLDERGMLTGWLDYHRATLAWKCDGLSPDQLRMRSVPPSTMSLLGLVRHMAEVERSWFRTRMAGDDLGYLYCSDDNQDGDFDDVDAADAAEALASWASECEFARGFVDRAVDLDLIATGWQGDPLTLRWVLTHMIEEYARHNGHADLIRECIDGATGD